MYYVFLYFLFRKSTEFLYSVFFILLGIYRNFFLVLCRLCSRNTWIYRGTKLPEFSAFTGLQEAWMSFTNVWALYCKHPANSCSSNEFGSLHIKSSVEIAKFQLLSSVVVVHKTCCTISFCVVAHQKERHWLWYLLYYDNHMKPFDYN